jgi:hypothetical protein
VFTDQGTIFQPHEITKLERLLSHVLIGGALVGVLAILAPTFAVLAAATLWVHLVADLVADIRDLNATNDSLR